MPSAEAGWWEVERARFIDDRVRPLVGPDALVADVGCGRGTVFRGTIDVACRVVRIDSHVWEEWRERPGVYVCAAADALPFRSGTFDVVGSFDVLEHLPDDVSALAEQRRVTRPSGSVVAAVPADRRLWSQHDIAVGHHRRYDSSSLDLLGREVGCRVERSTYFFSFLWLPAWLMRRSAARTSEPATSAGLAARVVRAVISGLSALERRVAEHVRIPIGSSAWVEWSLVEDRDGETLHRPATHDETTS